MERKKWILRIAGIIVICVVILAFVITENVAADFLFLGEVTSDSVTLSWEPVLNAEMYILYRDDGDGWGYQKIFQDTQTSEYRVTGLEGSTNYRFKLRYCMDLGCGDSADSNIVEVTTHPHGDYLTDPLPVILAVVLLIVGIVAGMLIVLRKRRAERD